MAAYRADIEIGVKGIQQLQAVTKQINTLSVGVDSVNKSLSGATQSINNYNANLAKAAATLNKVNAGTIAEADAVRQYVQALGQANAARDRQNKLIQQQINLQRKAIPTTNAGFGVQGPALPPGQRGNQNFGAGFGSAASNAIIGGAFPLLFGQGAGAAIGGGLGGALGGAFGGTLGFGLSLVGTAIGQAIDDAQKLNAELIGLNNNLSSTGDTSRTTASDVSKLASQLGIAKDEALKLVSAFSEFDSASVREALAASFGAVGGEEAFNALAAAIDNKSTLEAIVKLRDTITDSQAKEALKQLEINGSASANIFLQERLIKLQEEKLIKQAQEVTLLDRILASFAAIGAQGQFVDPALFGRERAQDIIKSAADRKKAQQQALQDTRKFLLEVNRLNERFTAKTPRAKAAPKGPEDRTVSLLADLDALRAIGEAEDRIRDLRFTGQDALAVSEQRTKTLADIERDRVKQLQQANFATEKAAINEIAKERAIQAQRLAADELRGIEFDRVQKAIEEKNVLDEAVQPIKDVAAEQKAQLEDAQRFNRLVREGILPAEAERLINFERLVASQIKSIDLELQLKETRATELADQVRLLEAKESQTDEVLAEIQARGLSINKIEEEIDALRARRKAISGAAAAGPGAAPTNRERLQNEIGQLQGQLNQLVDPINQITLAAQGISDAFASSFREIISGTVPVQQALSNFFNNIAASFLDNAAQIIAAQLQIFVLQQLLGFIGGAAGSSAGFGSSSVTLPGLEGAGALSSGSLFPGGAFAEGGFVTGPTKAIIGEGGSDEYVIPANKMAGAMQRYNAGVRGEAVLKGASSTEQSGGFALINQPTQINISGGVMQFNDTNYIRQDQVPAIVDQASRAGEARALRKLQQSPSARRKIGM